MFEHAQPLMRRAAEVIKAPQPIPAGEPIRAGVDLGTAFTVIFVTDESGQPLAGASVFADVVRDGVVWDFAGAQRIVRELREQLETATGRALAHGAVTIPPGVDESNHRAHRFVIEGAGLDCDAVIDETTAANSIIRVTDGAVVDIGGGTTGIAIVEGGEIVANYDEPTGGTHMSLVLAGNRRIPYEEAELLKRDVSHHKELFPVLHPVLEKISTIVGEKVSPHNVDRIALVGGSAMFQGAAEVMARVTGLPTDVAPEPMLVTPLGVASYSGLNT